METSGISSCYLQNEMIDVPRLVHKIVITIKKQVHKIVITMRNKYFALL